MFIQPVDQFIFKFSQKHVLCAFFLIIFLFTSFNKLKAQEQSSYISNDAIPYGFADLDVSTIASSYTRYTYESELFQSGTYAHFTEEIEKHRAKFYGVGIEGHFPLIYNLVSLIDIDNLANKDKRRFRIADDLCIGTYLSTGINMGLIAGIGIQGIYRINEYFDIGAKFYPYFIQYDYEAGNAQGKAFGLHARVQRFYIDYRFIPDKNRLNHYNASGFNFASVKYFYRPFNPENTDKYILFAFGKSSFNAESYIPSGRSIPSQLYLEFVDKRTSWSILKIGWGMAF